MSSPFAQSSRRPFFASALGCLISINVVIFLFQSAGFLHEHRVFDGKVETMQFGSLARSDLTDSFEWWRIITYMFVHAIPAPLHVGLNMLMVFVCGRVVQAALGGRALVQIYLLGGIAGALAHVILFPDPVVGASAAAFALLVALGMIIPEQKVFVLLGLVLPVRMRVKYLVVGMVGVTAIFFFIDLIAGPEADIPMITGVGHLAPLGGALAGYVYCRVTGVNRTLTLADLQAQRRASEAGLPIPASPSTGYNGGTIIPADRELDDFRMTEIDPILDKIVREGFLSLTPEERATLQRGIRMMSRT